MLDGIVNLDKDMTLGLNSIHCGATDQLWQFMSDVKVWVPLYIIAIYFIFKKFGWKKGAIVTIAAVLTILACDQFANFMKDTVARLRPCYDSDMMDNGLRVLEKKGGHFGFYSAHAANAFGLVQCIWIGVKKLTFGIKTLPLRIIAFCWAGLVAISRVFVGKHFLGDVLSGVIIGLFIGTMIGLAASYLAARISKATESSSPSQ